MLKEVGKKLNDVFLVVNCGVLANLPILCPFSTIFFDVLAFDVNYKQGPSLQVTSGCCKHTLIQQFSSGRPLLSHFIG